MKYIPNIITSVRIALFFPLLFSMQRQSLFVILYLICGVTDALDGYIARRTKTQTELGARLDSVADLLFFTAAIIWMVSNYGPEIRRFLPFLVLIGILRCINAAIAAYKYRSFVILHTWGNKLAGFLVFTTPILLIWNRIFPLWLVCITAFLSAAEETVIHLSSPQLNINRQSLFKN